jgi:hypothetical protein
MADLEGDVYFARHDAPDGKDRCLTREDELFFGGAVWAEMGRNRELARVVLGHAAIRELFGFDKYLAMTPAADSPPPASRLEGADHPEPDR